MRGGFATAVPHANVEALPKLVREALGHLAQAYPEADDFPVHPPSNDPDDYYAHVWRVRATVRGTVLQTAYVPARAA